MFEMVLSGLVIGFVMSAPLGPMAALGALNWVKGHRHAAVAVLAGTVTGDLILSLCVLSAFHLPELLAAVHLPVDAHVPWWVLRLIGFALLALMAVVVWRGADKPAEPHSGLGGFMGSLGVSLAHPGNIAAYATLYGVVMPVMAGRPITSLTTHDLLWLVPSIEVGMIAGWVVFLAGVEVCRRRWGEIPVYIHRRMAQVVSVMMGISAVAVLAV